MNPQKWQEILLKELKKFGLSPLTPSSKWHHGLSTGLFALDLAIGGGITPGIRFNIYGPEASGKTTIVYHIILSALREEIPVLYINTEGNIPQLRLQRLGIFLDNPLFKVIPTVADAQSFFGFIENFLSGLPPVDISSQEKPSVLIVVDSLAGIPVPTSEKSKMAAVAKFLGEGFRQIIPLLVSRGVSWIDTNHIRQRPGPVFGNPEYTPGGMANLHSADIRIRVGSISVPKKSGKVLEEVSPITGETNQYIYTKIKVEKNKLTFPYTTFIERIWIREGQNMGYGIDPIQDLYQYLELTHQVDYSQGFFRISLANGPQKTIRWNDWIEMILKWFYGEETDPILSFIFDQIQSGKGWDLFIGHTEEQEEIPEENDEEEQEETFEEEKENQEESLEDFE